MREGFCSENVFFFQVMVLQLDLHYFRLEKILCLFCVQTLCLHDQVHRIDQFSGLLLVKPGLVLLFREK